MPRSLTEAFSVEVSTRQAEAMRLRIRGLTLAQIAKELGYATPAGAHVAIKAGMEHNLAPVADQLRQLLCARYDLAYAEIREEWEKCLKKSQEGDNVISKRGLEVFDRMLRALDRHAAAAGLPRQGDILPALEAAEAEDSQEPQAPARSREERLAALLERLQTRQANAAVDFSVVVEHVESKTSQGASGLEVDNSGQGEGEITTESNTAGPGNTV